MLSSFQHPTNDLLGPMYPPPPPQSGYIAVKWTVTWADLFLESSVLPSDGCGCILSMSVFPKCVAMQQVPIYICWLIWRGSSMFLYIYLAINSRYQKVTNVTATLPYLTFALKWSPFLKLKNLWPKIHNFISILKAYCGLGSMGIINLFIPHNNSLI